MSKSLYFSAIASLTLTFSSVNAAELIPLRTTSLNQLKQTFQLVLPNVKSLSTQSPATNTLQFLQQHTDKNKITHVRMQQNYQGFPVFGGYAIIHSHQTANTLLAAKDNITMSGTIYGGLDKELGKPAADFVRQASAALQQFKHQYQSDFIQEEEVTPLIYLNENHQAVWAYQVSVLVIHANKIPERPTAILDAKTLKPLLQWNAIKTMRSAVNGLGYGGNHLTGEYQYGKDLPMLEISRNHISGVCYMENNDVKVVDMEHKYTGSSVAAHFNCNNEASLSTHAYWTGLQGDGYDLINGAFSPTNDALYAGQIIKSMYKDWYGLDVLTVQENPMKLIMRVHYGTGVENAYWDGKQMTFGDGATMMYPLVSLGVGAHEISHGFTEQHSNLQYFRQSGGMNEAFSDMAAQAAEYYSQGKNNWMIGSEIMKENSGMEALRYMDNPSRDGRSINKADQYRDGMDVHYTSGVYNHLFYLLATQPNWNVKQAFSVMVKANMDYWTPYSTFVEGGCGIIDAAKDLGLPVDDVKQALDKVAISDQNCTLP